MSVLYVAVEPTPQGADHAAQSGVAQRLLARLLTAAGHGEATVKKEKSGRPVVEKPGLAVSATHTEGLVFCALLATEKSDPRLGIDAERLRPYPRAGQLAARYFGPCERRAFAADPGPRTFFACFTKKEAFAKYCGDGLAHHLAGDDTAAPDFEAAHGVRFIGTEKCGAWLTVCLPADEFPAVREI